MKQADTPPNRRTDQKSNHLWHFTNVTPHGPNDGPGDVGTPKYKWVQKDPVPKRVPSTEGNGERI